MTKRKPNPNARPAPKSATSTKHAFNDGLPPLEKRVCFQLGMATANRRGEPQYDWALIQSVFMAWRGGTNVRAFCQEHHLPYEYSRKILDVRAKDTAVNSEALTYRSQLQSVMQLQRASNVSRDARAISNVLHDLQEIAAAGVAFARTKFFKTVDGQQTVNPTIPIADARRLVEMGVRASEIVKNVIAISGPGRNTEEHADPVPVRHADPAPATPPKSAQYRTGGEVPPPD